jgi:hypothetical protein
MSFSLPVSSPKNSFFFNERFGVFLPFMFGNSGIPVWMLAVIGRHGVQKGGIFFSRLTRLGAHHDHAL